MIYFEKKEDGTVGLKTNSIAFAKKFGFEDNFTESEEDFILYKENIYLKKERPDILDAVAQLELLTNELNSLYSWFEEYDNQVKQYQRCQRLGVEFDKDINDLDNQAKVNAERITEIRLAIGSNLQD